MMRPMFREPAAGKRARTKRRETIEPKQLAAAQVRGLQPRSVIADGDTHRRGHPQRRTRQRYDHGRDLVAACPCLGWPTLESVGRTAHGKSGCWGSPWYGMAHLGLAR